MKKINWGQTIFVALLSGIIFSFWGKSMILGSIFAIITLVLGIVYGLMFGDRKQDWSSKL